MQIAENNQNNMIELKKLASFVKEKENELAYGSETSLLSAFVLEFGFLSNAIESRRLINATHYDIWVDAYAKYEELTDAGIEFSSGDCF